VRFHEITQGVDPYSAHERRDDRSVLEHLLADSVAGGAPLTDAQLYEACSDDRRLAVNDALGRLEGDGLIERRGGRVIVSEGRAALRRADEALTGAFSHARHQAGLESGCPPQPGRGRASNPARSSMTSVPLSSSTVRRGFGWLCIARG
jgi:hypothetical protein